MKIITQRDLIKTVAKRWDQQYHPYVNDVPLFSARNGFRRDLTKKEIHEALKNLDPETCSAEEVNNIIGNSSWTNLTCNQCQKQVKEVIELGEEPDWESNTAQICFSCLEDAHLQVFRYKVENFKE